MAYKPGAKKTFLVGLGLTEDEGFETSKRVLDRAMDHYYSVSGFCWHPVYLAAKTLRLPVKYATDTHFRKCIAYAKSRGMGLTGTNAWNEFWRAREKVAIEDVVWNPASATLQYKVPGEVKVSALSFIAPLRFHGKKARISVNSRPANYTQANLFGGQYAMFAIDVGSEELLITARYDE